jgi:hypothetical protein
MRSWDKRNTLLFVVVAWPALLLLAACSSASTRVPTSSPATTPPAESSDCPTALDEDTLQRLTLALTTLSPTMEMQPGETHTFSLGVVECCYVFEPLQTCVTWSIDPTTGASINPDSGLFAVDAGTPNGRVFTVSADVEHGRRVVSVDVHVFTSEANPLARLWAEEAQLACDGGAEIAPQSPIGELRFRADGTFGVTWQPFEMYVDYWGTYTYDLEASTLDLTIGGGNYVPDDVDGSGTFSVDEQGYLTLKDMWLGNPAEGTGEANCGHRFH